VFYAFYLKSTRAIIPVTVIGLFVLGLDISEFNSPDAYYNNMIVVSKFSCAFSALFIIQLSSWLH
jgi:NADH-quinone oxidoreductase subunit N